MLNHRFIFSTHTCPCNHDFSSTSQASWMLCFLFVIRFVPVSWVKFIKEPLYLSVNKYSDTAKSIPNFRFIHSTRSLRVFGLTRSPFSYRINPSSFEIFSLEAIRCRFVPICVVKMNLFVKQVGCKRADQQHIQDEHPKREGQKPDELQPKNDRAKQHHISCEENSSSKGFAPLVDQEGYPPKQSTDQKTCKPQYKFGFNHRIYDHHKSHLHHAVSYKLTSNFPKVN